MAKHARTRTTQLDANGERFAITIRWTGKLAEDGEIPAAELGAALQGWDRFLQIAFHSYRSSSLKLPIAGKSTQMEFRVQRVQKGSFVVEAALVVGGVFLNSFLGNAPYELMKKAWTWSVLLAKTHIHAKRERNTLDGVVEELERVAGANDIRVSVDREDSEDFAAAINGALDNATIPLDSSAAAEALSMDGQAVAIVVDESSRQAIKIPFEPPRLDPDAEDVIEAPVKFVRINKKTGYGLLSFTRITDKSQLGQQRFHCQDKSIRRRANQYTGSFHEDVPLMVKMQRKNYAAERRGHYWLILGTASPATDDLLPFADSGEKNKGRAGRRQRRKSR